MVSVCDFTLRIALYFNDFFSCSRYPVQQATWEEEDSLGDLEQLLENFYKTIVKEKLDDDRHATVLLREAVQAGIVDPHA